MNLKKFDRSVIDSAFVFNKGLVEHERQIEKERLENKKRIEEIKAQKKDRKDRALRNSINSHYTNLVQFVKEIFSQPSELSNFVLSVASEKTDQTYIITRSVPVSSDPSTNSQENDLPPEFSGGVSMKMEEKSLMAIKLVKIPNLSDEKREYFVALVLPLIEGKISPDNFKDVDVIVYESVREKGGFEHSQESHDFVPSVELKEVLKSLCDINIFCKVLLETY